MDDENKPVNNEQVAVNKGSVLGLFIRRCVMDYRMSNIIRVSGMIRAYNEYMSGISGDAYFVSGEDPRSEGWVSEYNVQIFMKAQILQLERSGSNQIDPDQLNVFLTKVEIMYPFLAETSRLRYLNNIRVREYKKAVAEIHVNHDLSIEESNLPDPLLNLGRMEYSFGHKKTAISAFSDAQAASITTNDAESSEEIQYWISACDYNIYNTTVENDLDNDQSTNTFVYNDPYLRSLSTLSQARSLLYEGGDLKQLFECLYKTSISQVQNDIKETKPVHYLLSALTWYKLGNRASALSYMKLAKGCKTQIADDAEQIALLEADMLVTEGHLDEAIQVLDRFQSEFPIDSQFRYKWRQYKASILKKNNQSDQINPQYSILRFIHTDEKEQYIDGLLDQVNDALDAHEYHTALELLNETERTIRNKSLYPLLPPILIKQADIYMTMGLNEKVKPILTETMILTRKHSQVMHFLAAVIKQSEVFLLTGERDKAIYMMETITPKVLSTGSVYLRNELIRVDQLIFPHTAVSCHPNI
ncbi:hypothetical protein BDB01DRAFT_793832 [Pilobolus umbonatus]|nr:hypothetical protein BDB01DRAFT_793832 [Pilobolus umbonatus]